MSMPTRISSVWQETPLWIRGAVFALCLYAILAGLGIVTGTALFGLPIRWFDPSRPGLVFAIQSLGFLASAVELGPGLLVLPSVDRGFALSAAMYSLVGAVCFTFLGVRRGAILTSALILVIAMGSLLTFFLLNIG